MKTEKKRFSGVIYMLTCEMTGKSYVGQTIDLKRRLYYHFNPLAAVRAKNVSLLYRHMMFFGSEAFKVSVLEEIVDSDETVFRERMLVAEKDYILKYDCIENGYNLELGNEITDQMKEHLRFISKGREISEETRAKMSVANSGRRHMEETKKKIGDAHRGEKNANYGEKASVETRRKQSEARKGEKNHFYGKTHSRESLLKISKSRSGKLTGKDNPSARRVRNIDTGKEFDTMKEAAAHYGIASFNNIVSACRGRLKTVGGFRWEYAE